MGVSENRARLRRALQGPGCTPAVAIMDPYTARLAYKAGWEYGKLNSSTMKAVNYGLPDDVNGTGNFTDYADVVRRIRRMAPDISIIVDAEYCGGTPMSVAVWVRELEAAGASGIEIEDRYYSDDFLSQLEPEQGMRPVEAQVANLKAALAAREDPTTVITARTTVFTPALSGAVEVPMKEALDRVRAYAEAGADAVFIPAVPSRIRNDIAAIHKVTDIPLVVLRMPADLIQDEKFLRENNVRMRYLSQSTVFEPMTIGTYERYRELKGDKTGIAAMRQLDAEYGEWKSLLNQAQSWKLLCTPQFRSVGAAFYLQTKVMSQIEDKALQDRVRTAFWARVDEPADANAERDMRSLVAELRRKHPAVATSLAEATSVADA